MVPALLSVGKEGTTPPLKRGFSFLRAVPSSSRPRDIHGNERGWKGEGKNKSSAAGHHDADYWGIVFSKKTIVYDITTPLEVL